MELNNLLLHLHDKIETSELVDQINTIIEELEDIADQVEDYEEETDDLNDQIEDLDNQLQKVEEQLYHEHEQRLQAELQLIIAKGVIRNYSIDEILRIITMIPDFYGKVTAQDIEQIVSQLL